MTDDHAKGSTMPDQSPVFWTNVFTPVDPQSMFLSISCGGEQVLKIERKGGIFVAEYDEASLDAAAKVFVNYVNMLFGNASSTQ